MCVGSCLATPFVLTAADRYLYQEMDDAQKDRFQAYQTATINKQHIRRVGNRDHACSVADRLRSGCPQSNRPADRRQLLGARSRCHESLRR